MKKNPTSKKPPITRGVAHPLKQRATPASAFRQAVAQPKTGSGKRPVAPPVYKPQPLPKVAQAKKSVAPAGVSAQSAKRPVAPPVYKPQATRVGVQAKMAGPAQTKTHPVAPPVYRPQPVPRVLQTKKTISSANKNGHALPRVERDGAKRIGAPMREISLPKPQSSPKAIQRKVMSSSQSRVIQAAMWTEGTYVEVDDGGSKWYGAVKEQLDNSYRVRVGGTEDHYVTVPKAKVVLHPTIARSLEEYRNGETVMTAGGTWTAVEYNSKMGRKDPSARGLHILLRFTPNHTVDARKIVLVQTVTAMKNEAIYFKDESVELRSRFNVSIDQRGDSASPEYIASPETSGGVFGEAPVEPGAGEHGYRYQPHNSDQWLVKAAWLTDNPFMINISGFSQQKFETTAIAAEGKDKGRYYGSVAWGWVWQPRSKVRLVPLQVVNPGYGASPQFKESAKQWNQTRLTDAPTVPIPLQKS